MRARKNRAACGTNVSGSPRSSRAGEAVMGWRDVFRALIRQTDSRPLLGDETAAEWAYRRGDEVAGSLLHMPAPDRLALARELLPAGFVVARDVTADDLPGIKAQILNRRAGVGEGE